MGYPWSPDQGDGTFRNPVLHADYSDPDVLRHGDDFWLVASSFTSTPGLPILHSRDLVNWTIRNHAIKNLPHPRFREVQPGCGVWAPALRFHAGRFWIFFPMPDEGIYVVSADDPAGTWSEPWCLQEAKGWIDPCPFWDDDGKAYFVHAYANSRAGKKERIHIRPMSPDCTRLLGEGQEVIHAPHHAYLEGPKVHKLNGWYYILAPGGGVPQGWQVVFRSRSLFGPYEEKVVLEKGSTPINGPHQGALVDLPNGEWWFLHFQDAGAYGRIVHMQPVVWKDNWPLMGVDYDGNGEGEPVPAWRKPAVAGSVPVAAPQTSDDFNASKLGLQWQWQANHDEDWYSLAARPGWLRLYAQPAAAGLDLGLTPALLMQKFPARAFTVETLLDIRPAGARGLAGLAVVGGGESAALAYDGGACVLMIKGQPLVANPVSGGSLRLRVSVDETATCRFSWAAEAGPFIMLPQVFQAKHGGWMGAKAGLFCLSIEPASRTAHADFDYVRFSP
jgi:beta-xylosidase